MGAVVGVGVAEGPSSLAAVAIVAAIASTANKSRGILKPKDAIV